MGIQDKDKKEKMLIEKYGEFSAEAIKKHLRDGNSNNIRSQYSIKESAKQIAQKTNRSAIDKIAEIVRSKIQEIKTRIADSLTMASSDVDEHQITTLVLEEIEVGDLKRDKSNNTNLKEPQKAVAPIDLDDSHTR